MKNEVIETTTETGARVTTPEDMAIHRARVIVEREAEAVRALQVEDPPAFGRLCDALNRLALACASMSRVVGDNVGPDGWIDFASFPQRGPTPDEYGGRAVAWDGSAVVYVKDPDDEKIGPFRWTVIPS